MDEKENVHEQFHSAAADFMADLSAEQSIPLASLLQRHYAMGVDSGISAERTRIQSGLLRLSRFWTDTSGEGEEFNEEQTVILNEVDDVVDGREVADGR